MNSIFCSVAGTVPFVFRIWNQTETFAASVLPFGVDELTTMEHVILKVAFAPAAGVLPSLVALTETGIRFGNMPRLPTTKTLLARLEYHHGYSI